MQPKGPSFCPNVISDNALSRTGNYNGDMKSPSYLAATKNSWGIRLFPNPVDNRDRTSFPSSREAIASRFPTFNYVKLR